MQKEEWLTETILLKYSSNEKLAMVKYFKLHGNPRAYAIQSKSMEYNDNNKSKVIKQLKEQITDERKYITPMYGMTFYC